MWARSAVALFFILCRAGDRDRRHGREGAVPLTTGRGLCAQVRSTTSIPPTRKRAAWRSGRGGPALDHAGAPDRGPRPARPRLGVAAGNLAATCCCARAAARAMRATLLRRRARGVRHGGAFRAASRGARRNGPTTCWPTAQDRRHPAGIASRAASARAGSPSASASIWRPIPTAPNFPPPRWPRFGVAPPAADDALIDLAARFAKWYDVWSDGGLCRDPRRLAGAGGGAGRRASARGCRMRRRAACSKASTRTARCCSKAHGPRARHSPPAKCSSRKVRHAARHRRRQHQHRLRRP